MAGSSPAISSRSRSMMAAVVLGTALTAGTSTTAHAGTPTDPSPTVVGDLSRYCQVCWRNARLPLDSWPDCTQQVFTRLLERVEPTRWGEVLGNDGMDKREFLRAIDAVKKRTQRARRFTDLSTDVADHKNPWTDSARDEWEVVNKAAERVLSPRQRKIVELTATGWAVPDIAEELGTTAERISDEKYKAIHKLREHLVEN
jgi:hypothetical protein